MSQSAFGIAPFSTRVELWLDCEFGRIALSQVGATFVMASAPSRIPACKATVIVSVDGKEFARPVQLINGMNEADSEATILADDALPF